MSALSITLKSKTVILATVYQLFILSVHTACPTTAAAALVATPSPLAFGNSNVTVAATKTVSIKNSAATFQTLSPVTITGITVSDFTIANDLCSNHTINANEVCTLDVVFTPSAIASRTATLNISSATDTTTLPITGSGVVSVIGIITDLSTAQPLSGVTVTLTPTAGTPTITASKTDGSFSFTPAYGTYSVTLSKANYSGYTVNNISPSATKGIALKMGIAPTGILNIVTTPPLVPIGIFVDNIKISGGVGSYSFTIPFGALPPGLALDSVTGAITGVPTTAGTYTFSVGVTDSDTPPNYAEREFTVNIPVIVTPSYLPRATQNIPYSASITAQSPTTLTFTSTALPPGLTLSATTGFVTSITGTPTTVGSYSFDLTATDTSGRSYRKTFRMYVEAPLALTTATLAKGEITVSYSQQLVGSGGFPPYTWTLDAGTLPSGLALNPITGVISGVPTLVESKTVTLTLHDYLNRNTPVSRQFTLDILPEVVLLTTTLNRTMQNTTYSATLSASDGVPPYSFSATLPTGLTLSSAGIIGGKPTVAGTFTFNITVTDSVLNTDTKSVTLIIDPALSVTTTALTGLINTLYSQTLAATGGFGAYSWGITAGTLPGNITLISATGLLSGTVPTTSRSSITVMVTDSFGRTATRIFTMDFAAPLLLSTSIARGTQNSTYSSTLTASGGTTAYKYALTGGSLPAGLTLNGTTGVISGTPTVAGTYICTFKVTDSVGRTDSRIITINIDAVLTITTTPLPIGPVGVPYSQTLAASGGFQPYTWVVSLGFLPAGLTLDSTTGVISGTPLDTLRPVFTVTASDANSPVARTASKQFSIDNLLVLSAPVLTNGMVGKAYTATLTATGGTSPYHYSLTSGALPTGITLNVSTGVISGVPSVAGNYTFNVTVFDINNRSDTKTLSLVIDPVTSFYISTPSLPPVTAYTAYNQPLTVVGGVAPYTWSVKNGSLTTGLSLNPATGIISGIPTTDFTSWVIIGVTDSGGLTASRQFIPPLTVHTLPVMPDASLSAPYLEDFVVSGGFPPYTYTLTGQLPAGLSFNDAIGRISGTPTVGGYTNARITIADSVSTSPLYKPTKLNISLTFGIRVWSGATIITPANFASVKKSVAITPVTLTATGGAAFSWSLVSGTLPPGLALSREGVITGTPTTTGDYAFTISATDGSTSAAPTSSDETGKNRTFNSLAPVTVSKLFYLRVDDATTVSTLSVTVLGNGNGFVNSNPAGIIACSTGTCTGEFSSPTVTLEAFPSTGSFLKAWIGCTSSNAVLCSVTMGDNRSVTATFNLETKAMTGGIGYYSLNEAYQSARSGGIIQLLGTTLYEDLRITSNDFVLKGGYLADFQTQSGQTILNGDISVLGGNSSAESIDIKGRLAIGGGSLRVNGVTVK